MVLAKMFQGFSAEEMCFIDFGFARKLSQM
jgi:hypothetical protein